ncbi:DUF4856 domain-containing protein [Saprospiraceae bacterium]|nr:DUF4856 domain-containing protein [Saprospiraceae bacterium]
MTNKFIFFTLITFTTLLVACNPDANKEINEPTAYDFTRNAESTVSFDGQTTRIAMSTELVGAMVDFDNTPEQLVEMFANVTATGGDANPFSDTELNESTKSVQSKVAASMDFFSTNTAESSSIKADLQSWIIAQSAEVGINTDVLAEAGKAGQISDGTAARYVNAKGLEYNQAVAKSLIGGLMLDQICNNYLSTSVLDAASNIIDNDSETTEDGEVYTTMEHKWDEAYGYLFGFSTDASDPLVSLGEDAFLNKYLSRVNDDADFAGIADAVWDAFKLGRAAIVAGAYDVRDEQAAIIRDKLSKVIAIRAVYYMQQGKNAIPTDGTSYGPAFHDLSEGFGFIYSLRFTRKSDSNNSYFSREEVDGFIAQLTEGNGFWSVSAETLDEISTAIALKFDFTVAEAAE